MRVNNENLLDDSGPLDASLPQNLKPIWLGHILNFSVQVTLTGSPAGVLKLQASNDEGRIDASESANQAQLTNWTDLGVSVTVSGAGSFLLNQSNIGYEWVRVVWTPSGGSGSIAVARAYVKGV